MPDLQPPDLSRTPAVPVPSGALPPPLPRPGIDPASRALEENAAVMLATARRVSLCEADADDAVQAAAERFLKHRERVDPETVTGWLVTVSRNEALRVRERRVRTGAIDEDDRRLVHTGDGPEDVVARQEELELAREALGRLKPQERLALWMQAEGRSYDEIAEELSWTRTKVNRNISEGRARLRVALSGIATGEGCAVAAPRIDRLAAGDASKQDLQELRPHLRRCASCRGRLRQARGGRWSLLPPVLLAWMPWAGRGSGVAPPGRSRITELVAERVATVLPATSGAVSEVGLAVTTGLAVVALGAGVATGGSSGADDRSAPQSGRPVARAAAPGPSPIAAVASAGTTFSSGVASGTAAVQRRAAVRERAAEDEREARARERRREAAASRRRAARRAAARARAADAARAAAVPAPAAAAPSAPAASGGAAAGPAGGATSSGAGSSGGGSPSGGGSSSGGGSAASEFGFE